MPSKPYAVRPNGVIQHLTQPHRSTSAPDARQIQGAVLEWEGIEADIQQLQLPRYVP
jgi:hypothetical protein